jgi:hypothetical protein
VYYCPTCGAVVTNSGRRLIGACCWFCRDILVHVDTAPALDYQPAACWAPAVAEARARANAHAESEA